MAASSSTTAITCPQTPLSTHDTLILSTLFTPDALSPPSPISLSLPALPLTPLHLLPHLQSLELAAIKPLNTPSPSPAIIKEAITALSALIEEDQMYASAYNNRAQARRMMMGVGGDNLREVSGGDVWRDLGKAIELAGLANSIGDVGRVDKVEGGMVSPLQAKILASAYTHRGHLLWRLSKSTNPPPPAVIQLQNSNSEPAAAIIPPSPILTHLPESLRKASKETLEEMASRDFEQGGRYGNEVAREMAKRTNPYARLCGDIVREAMRGELLGNGVGN